MQSVNVAPELLDAQLALEDANEGQLRQAVRRAQLLRCALRGLTATEAARYVGCCTQTAQHVYADPGFRRTVMARVEGVFASSDTRFAERQKSLTERMEEKAVDAFEVLCELLDSPETMPSLRARVAQDLLDRNPETQAGRTVTHRDDLAEALQIAASAAREMDAKVVEIRKHA